MPEELSTSITRLYAPAGLEIRVLLISTISSGCNSSFAIVVIRHCDSGALPIPRKLDWTLRRCRSHL